MLSATTNGRDDFILEFWENSAGWPSKKMFQRARCEPARRNTMPANREGNSRLIVKGPDLALEVFRYGFLPTIP